MISDEAHAPQHDSLPLPPGPHCQGQALVPPVPADAPPVFHPVLSAVLDLLADTTARHTIILHHLLHIDANLSTIKGLIEEEVLP